MRGPLYSDGLSDDRALEQLTGGAQFQCMPRFEWRSNGRYVDDKLGALLLIGPVA